MQHRGYPVYGSQSPRPRQKLIVHARISRLTYNTSIKGYIFVLSNPLDSRYATTARSVVDGITKRLAL